tara:strand:- start:128 stop:973 length:846 start_codon:yes stop_codon:yes gene_type:complete
MNIIEYRNLFRKVLSPKFELNEIDFIYKTLLNSFFNLESTVIGLNPKLNLLAYQEDKLENALELIHDDCPLQYVTGKASFLDFEIFVNSNVLIPRPETEELVYWVSKSCIKGDNVFDLCTGSGCIALGLKKLNPSLKVTGIDISKKAILMAEKNSKKLNLDIDWEVKDLKQIKYEDSSLDIIVSNPPYIYPGEKNTMQPRVLNYEPHIALFTPNNDPVLYYKYCINFAKKSLRNGGKLFFEINPNYIIHIENLLSDANFSNIEIRDDLFGKKRMLSSEKNE